MEIVNQIVMKKISEVKPYVLEWLKQRGITVDEAKLDAMIESAVYELKSGVLAVGELSTSGGDET